MGTKCVSISGVEVIRRRALASSPGTRLGKVTTAVKTPAKCTHKENGLLTWRHAAMQTQASTTALQTGVWTRNGAPRRLKQQLPSGLKDSSITITAATIPPWTTIVRKILNGTRTRPNAVPSDVEYKGIWMVRMVV